MSTGMCEFEINLPYRVHVLQGERRSRVFLFSFTREAAALVPTCSALIEAYVFSDDMPQEAEDTIIPR